MNIIICDDEKAEIEYLRNSVYEWARQRKATVNISSYESAEAFLFSYETDKTVDILLLDIQMRRIDGVTLAKQLRADGGKMQIIFITGFPDHIQEGYDVSALHYLMKPVSEEKLYSVLDKAAGLLDEADASVLLDTGDSRVRLFHNDIWYAEAFAHKTTIRTGTGTTDIRHYITELEEMLGDGFCRVHRSYLVNLKYIRQITKTGIIMDCGNTIPLSRRRYDAVNKAFIKFYRN